MKRRCTYFAMFFGKCSDQGSDTVKSSSSCPEDVSIKCIYISLYKTASTGARAFSYASLVLVRVSSGHKYSLEICYAVTDLKKISLDYWIFSTVSQVAVGVHTELKKRGLFFYLKNFFWSNLNKNITHWYFCNVTNGNEHQLKRRMAMPDDKLIQSSYS